MLSVTPKFPIYRAQLCFKAQYQFSFAKAVSTTAVGEAIPVVEDRGILTKKASLVNADNMAENEEFQHDASNLLCTLDAFRSKMGFGRAIAAPQIGVRKRFIAVNLAKGDVKQCPEDQSDPSAVPMPADWLTGKPGKERGRFVMVNPVIYWRSQDLFTMWDDCMSFPDILVRLERHRSISVRFVDALGCPHDWQRLDQSTSELIQHEVDHLDGVVMLDRAEDLLRRSTAEWNISGKVGLPPVSIDRVDRKEYFANRDEYDSLVDIAIPEPDIEK